MPKRFLVSFPANKTNYSSYWPYIDRLYNSNLAKSLIIDFRDPEKCHAVAPIANWNILLSMILIEPRQCYKLFMQDFIASLNRSLRSLVNPSLSYKIEECNQLTFDQLTNKMHAANMNEFKFIIVNKIFPLDDPEPHTRPKHEPSCLGWRCSHIAHKKNDPDKIIKLRLSSTYNAITYMQNSIIKNRKLTNIINRDSRKPKNLINTYYKEIRNAPSYSLHHMHKIKYSHQSDTYKNTDIFLIKTNNIKIAISFAASIIPDKMTSVLVHKHEHNKISNLNIQAIIKNICSQIYQLLICHIDAGVFHKNKCQNDLNISSNHSILRFQCKCRQPSLPTPPNPIPCRNWIAENKELQKQKVFVIILHIPNAELDLDSLHSAIDFFPKQNIKWVVSTAKFKYANDLNSYNNPSFKLIEFENWEQSLCDNSWGNSSAPHLLINALKYPNII